VDQALHPRRSPRDGLLTPFAKNDAFTRSGGTFSGVIRRDPASAIHPYSAAVALTLRKLGWITLLVLGAAACGTTSADLRFEAVPESVWPAIKGVEVQSMHSSDGERCCEQQEGSLSLRIDLSGNHPYQAFTQGMRDAGWYVVDCPRPGRYFFARAGFNGWTDPTNTQGADLFVFIERGGPVSDYLPGCREPAR
jgi:hypothetical protein